MLDLGQQGKLFQYNQEYSHNDPVRYGKTMLYQIGEVHYEEGYQDIHEQWCFEISVILSGVGIFSVGEKSYVVKENDIIITPCHGIHTIQAKDNKLRYLYLGFTFAEHNCDSIKEIELFFNSSMTNYKRTDSYDVGSMMNCLLNEFHQERPFMDQLISNYLENILIMTYRTFTITYSKLVRAGENPHTVGSTIYSVIKYVENNIYSIIDIKTIAAELNFNYSYLSHMFRKKTGITLQQHIMHKKIEKGCELIKEGRLSMTDIALMLNYESLQSFSKAFKHVMGVSPRTYKNKS